MASFKADAIFQSQRRTGGKRPPQSLADALVAIAIGEPAAPPTPDETTSAPAAPSPGSNSSPSPSREVAPLEFGEHELAALLAAAATSARAACLVEMENDHERQKLVAENAIAGALAAETIRRQSEHARDTELVMALVETIARHVVPQALAARPLDDLKAALPELFARLNTTADLQISVNPSLVDELASELVSDAANECSEASLQVVADVDLAPGAAVVRWAAGEARQLPEERITEAVALCAGWLVERDATSEGHAVVNPEPMEALNVG